MFAGRTNPMQSLTRGASNPAMSIVASSNARKRRKANEEVVIQDHPLEAPIRQQRGSSVGNIGNREPAVTMTSKRVSPEAVVLHQAHTPEDLDMSLSMKADQHLAIVKMVVKGKLFRVLKFITEGQTDMQFSEQQGSICHFLLNQCSVVGNQRMWWQTYAKRVRSVLNDTRNNKIKCIQNAYYGKCARQVMENCRGHL